MNVSLQDGRTLRRTLHWASRVEALPPAAWLAIQAAALWPSWTWAARRMADGSDEPLGLVALAMLALAAGGGRTPLRTDARRAWMAAALACTVTATVGLAVLPPLAVAMLAALALAAGFATFRADGSPWLPIAGLLLLSLPVVASAQFYAGWPLRVVTAEASRWLLVIGGFAVERAGTVLMVNGREILVDAPCSGVQLAWLGYASACASALWHGTADRAFLARLPLVGLTVLGANVLRNTTLVALESGVGPVPTGLHEGIGIVVLAAVTVVVAGLMKRAGRVA